MTAGKNPVEELKGKLKNFLENTIKKQRERK